MQTTDLKHPKVGPNALFVILGNQLFPFDYLKVHRNLPFFMAEDVGLCTYVRHHKQKIILFLAAMRSYADDLRDNDIDLTYLKLDDKQADRPYEDKLRKAVKDRNCDELVLFEVEDHFFEQRLRTLADELGVRLTFLPGPMFLTTRQEFRDYLDQVDKPFMANFYQRQRKRLGLLLDEEGKPIGGKWSFDADNRKKLPKKVVIPKRPTYQVGDHVAAVTRLVNDRFADHPGDAEPFWLPTTRRQALVGLRAFLEDHFHLFGDYEDALSSRDPFLFHSVLTPALNLGLITPAEVIERVMEEADKREAPLNSLEGFVRQIIGWREFIRGVYHNYDDQQQQANFFHHQRKMTEHWYRGDTGLPPLDDAIQKAIRYGWTHHIERLMVLGNLMVLCEIHPPAAHRWFMEMYVDSSDWVMGPNVYGMGLFSDGGVFSTKPYICGSNYLLKMSDYQKGDWCDTLDGLYWRFIAKHRDYFASNPRLSVMTRALDKLKPDRRERITRSAEAFLDHVTAAG